MMQSPFLASSAPRAAVNNTHSLMCRATKSEFRKIVAERILKARELNGLTQTDAAKLFGYNTPAQLSQWEQNKRLPPMQKIIQASHVYRVSVDYLVGVSSEPDRDPLSAERLMLLNSVGTTLDGMTRSLVETIMAQVRIGGPTIQSAYSFLQEGDRMLSAFERFVSLNPEYEDMKGGNTLAVAAESFKHNGIGHARQQLERHRRINGDAMHAIANRPKPVPSLDLFENPRD